MKGKKAKKTVQVRRQKTQRKSSSRKKASGTANWGKKWKIFGIPGDSLTEFLKLGPNTKLARGPFIVRGEMNKARGRPRVKTRCPATGAAVGR